ncbi:MAG: SirB2 family protein [Thioploca sp.]|nr:SirB2 family protein [Thioploca sp.]
MYLTLKSIHIFCVLLTFLSFFIRGIWMIQNHPRLQQRWVKIVPHLIDSVLLLSGISLVFTIHQYPFINHWLTAKLLALLLYIILGSIALKRGKTKTIRLTAWISALGAFLYMVTVAITRVVNPLIW